MKYFLLTTLTLVTIFTSRSQDITENKFGSGLLNMVAEDSSYSLKFAARFQSLYTSNWIINNENALKEHNSNLMIRRARLKFGGFAYSPKLVYKIELGLSNRDISGASEYTGNAPRILLDAVVKWNFYGNFVLWAGQTKLPGNRERLISSGDLQFVDRSLLNKHFNIDREMGVQLHHHFTLGERFIIKEAVALSKGEGRNVVTGNLGGMQWTAKAEIFPFGEFESKGAYTGGATYREEKPKLAIAVSYDHNDAAVKNRSNMGSYLITDEGYFETDINTFFLDAMFKYRAFSFMGEYANRSAEHAVALNSDGSETGDIVNVGNALNLQSGYLFKNNIELSFRYTQVDFVHIDNYVQDEYSLGVSKYIQAHKLKVQTDLSYGNLANDPNDNLMYRLQFDIHF